MENRGFNILKLKNKGLSIVSVGFLIITVLMVNFSGPVSAQNSKADEMQKEIDELNIQIDFLKIKVKGSASKTSRLNRSISAKRKEIQELKAQIEQLNKGIEETEISVRKLESEAEACNLRIKGLLARYKSRLVQLHKIKQGTLLSSILAAKDINSFLNRYQMVKYLLENDRKVIEALNNEEEQRVRLVKSFNEKNRHLEQNKAELVKKEKKLNAESNNLNAMLSTVVLEKKILVNREKKLIKERENLEKGLKELDKIITKALPTEEKTKEPPKPIQATKEVTPDNLRAQVMQFHWPVPKYLREKVHEIDENGAYAIAVEVKGDAEIQAAAKGKVVYKGSISGLGEVVILQHERGFTTVYARLDNIWVGLNEVLDKGEVVGKIAAGGRNASLHFEIRFGSRKQRPLEYLPN